MALLMRTMISRSYSRRKGERRKPAPSPWQLPTEVTRRSKRWTKRRCEQRPPKSLDIMPLLDGVGSCEGIAQPLPHAARPRPHSAPVRCEAAAETDAPDGRRPKCARLGRGEHGRGSVHSSATGAAPGAALRTIRRSRAAVCPT